MNILLIEDDVKVQGFVKESLTQEGFSVIGISTLDELEELDFFPELIVLDRLLGSLDSKHYLAQIKKRYQNSLILILSALNSPHEKAELLDLGADDYLGKPFSIVELSARVRSLLRRGNKIQNYLQVGDLIIHMVERKVTSQGRRVDLTNKEFQLLKCLAVKTGKVFSKFQLMDLVWESNLELESNVLEVTVMNIRRKLSEVNSSVTIHSKRNIGYWIEV